MSISNFKKIFIVFVGVFIFSGVFFSNPVEAQASCMVTQASVRPTGSQPAANPTGNDFTGSYDDGDKPFVYLDVTTSECLNQTIQLKIVNAADYNINASNNQQFLIYIGPNNPNAGAINSTPNEQFTIALYAGESPCYQSQDPDCQLAFVFFYNNNVVNAVGSSGNSALSYNCSYGLGACDENWGLQSIIDYGTDSPYDTDGVTPVGGLIPYTTSADYDSYLAPLPGLAGQPAGLKGFLEGLFQVLIVIAGILAMIMIVIGAITYLSTDAFSGKSSGREMMLNAVLGLVMALGAWIILNTINPNLASSLSIKIPQATLHVTEGDASVYGNQATTSAGGTITAFTLPQNIGLNCPGNGGPSAIPAIIDSFVDKVAYRWGGKGGALPAGASYPLSPAEQNGSPFMCKNDTGESVPCNSFCPGGNVCLDCSGFVNHVRQCAGSPVYATGTAGMVANADAEPVNMSQLNAAGTQIGSYTLVPGDILVWNGHVVIYYGNGKIAESLGGSEGRAKNGNVRISNTKKYKNKITHIIKIQQ